jgi:ElaB/YqjD/DUF883 family membrane-anchored ribosome-binding protein
MNETGSGASLTNGPETWESESQAHGTGLNQIKTNIADKLRSAAGSLKGQASRVAGRNENMTGYGNQAADWLNRSADYVEEFDPKQLRSDVESQVRRNPGRSLLIAGAAGLILGALLKRR